SPPSPADPRFPRPHADEERSPGSQAPSRQGPEAADGLLARLTRRHTARAGRSSVMSLRLGPEVRLRSREEFKLVQQQGRRVAAKYMTVLALPNALDRDRLGIIASRRLGGAVVRNRAKRRVREVFRHQQPDESARRGFQPLDIVVIPRRELVTAPFEAVTADFVGALGRLDRARRR